VIPSRRSQRFPAELVPAAVLVTALLFGAAAFLVRDRASPPQDITSPLGVSLVRLDAPALPVEEAAREPERPPEQAPMEDFLPDVVQPDLAALGPSDLGITINLSGVTGISTKRDFVFEAYELDQPPQPIVRVPPPYPYAANEQGVEGVVQVKVLVTMEGTVGDIVILDAKPKGVFEDSVRRTLPQWRFAPGKVGGKAVTAWVVTTIHFRLNQRGD
jgi:protein TonB